MKSFMDEFKAFISRGNVMDMAVGIIIGGAFTAIVNSLVEDLISPLLGLFGGMNFDHMALNLSENVTLNYGKFITALINFLIIAFVLFSIIKALNAAAGKLKKEEEEAAPTTKMCPYCKSEDIPLGACKCLHCGSELELSEEEKAAALAEQEAAAAAE
ncbi:MAG: large conductance mechanosensitive channel protein MscL [Eubacteriales bacterium]|nr:large conductance mechanosensitive channel protein MscL [Eubacteriales bacterium]